MEAAVGAALSVLQRAGGPQQQTSTLELKTLLPAQVQTIMIHYRQSGHNPTVRSYVTEK